MAQYRILKDAVKASKQLENEIISYSTQLLNQNQPDLYSINSKKAWLFEYYLF